MARDPDAFERGEPVEQSFFRGQAREIAPALLGKLLLVESDGGSGEDDTEPVGGLVVETEAYINELDPACHLSAGRTPRTKPFFSGPGTIYVYSIHGVDNLNVITSFEDHPEGILIRAVEPTHGWEVMRERRGFEDPTKLASGPGRLTEALGITKAEFNDRPLRESRLELYHTDVDPEVTVSPRVGVTSAEDWPLRFTIAGSDYVSQPVRASEALDWEAVEACYDRLRADGEFATIDEGS